MRTIRMKARIDKLRNLSLPLPPDTPEGMVDVIILFDAEENALPQPEPVAEEFEELLAFHKGRRLNGLTLKELASEGRP